MPALERLAVRQVSPRFLSQDERIEIADLRQAGLSVREIALKVGRAPSTISRELRRNASGRRVIARSRRIEWQPRGASVIIGAASRPTSSYAN